MVEIDEGGGIKAIDNCDCRRLVISFGQIWWRCSSGKVKLQEVMITKDGEKVTTKPPALEAGTPNLQVTVSGENFASGLNVYLGNGVTIKGVAVNSDTQLTFNMDVNEAASFGLRSLIVVNPDCSTGILPEAIAIVDPQHETAIGSGVQSRGRRTSARAGKKT